MKKILLSAMLLTGMKAAQAQCPDLSTPRKPMASSFHSSVIIDYNNTVRYWGDGASPVSAGSHVYVPNTLTGYTGTPRSVAAGSVGATAMHQLYLHTTDTIYGWGYSNRTIVAGTAGNVGLTMIALPTGVRTSDVNFIEASTGGLAVVTNTGHVYVRRGSTTSGTGRIYGDGSTGLDGTTIWHEVLTAPATPLSGVTRISFSDRALMALTSSNAVYVWGDATCLGDGTGPLNREYASLMTMPAGITPIDVNINSRTGENAAQFILGNDQKMHGVGNNASAALGQGSGAAATYTSWVTVKGPDGIGTLDNIVLIGSNNPYQYTTNAFAVGALTSAGKLYLWGNNNYDMIGGDTLSTPSKDSVTYTVPRVPPNFTYNNAAIGFFEMGGHTTAAFLAGSSKFCYIGHKVRGSMGDNDASGATNLTRKSFDCINTPEEFVCPPAPAIGCPLPSANDIFASSNHATLVINGEPSVAFWGEAASSAEPGINLTAAKTLYEYSGRPIGVAASAVSAATSAQGTQMWVQTDQGVWGWGYSGNTVQTQRLNSVPITSLALPSGVTAATTSFIRSSRGGIALITTTGAVWIKAGPGSACSFNVYGDNSAALDTFWHQVTTAPATPLTGVVEMSFGGTAALAITGTGTAYVWGVNTFLGDGSGATTRSRAALMTLHGDFTGGMKPRSAEIIQSGALAAVQFIVGANNRAYSIGSNANGALGNGTPLATISSSSWNTVSLTGIRRMSSNNPFADGFYSAGAIQLTGNVYLWGANTNGMLGAGATADLITPTVASTIPANDASNFEIGGHETIIFSKTNSRFYFAGRNRGGSRADGTGDGNVTAFTLAGTVSNCAAGAYNIGGKLLNDNNGMTDNLVNGAGISTIRTTPMYANLLDEGGYVIETKAITADTFTFVGYPFGNYYVQISATSDTLFKLGPTTTLPANWVFTGEQIGITPSAGIDTGVANGRILVPLTGNKTNVNFGVQQLPAPVADTLNARVNPGGTKTSPITTAFTGIDTLGTITRIHITGFPTNATSITIGAMSYTAGSFPGGGVTYTVAGTVVALDPIDGAVTSVIPFRVIDNANFESPATANATIPFVLIPPVANNIIAPALNSSDTARMIPQLKASNPSGTPIASYTVLTVPPLSEGRLYYCATAPGTPCTLGGLTQITAVTVLTPDQSASLYFDPAQLHTGDVSFTYSATDQNALTSNIAYYRIPVFNTPPVTQSIRTSQVLDTHSKVWIPRLIAADIDGSVLTYTLSLVPPASSGTLSYCSNGTDTCTGVRVTVPSSGSTPLTPAQMNTMKFHPVLGATGEYIFSYTATDNNGLLSNISTYTIPVVTLIGGNFPPVATNITAQNINNSLGQTPIPNLLGTDPDGLIDHYTIGGTLPPATQGVLYYCVSPGAGCATSPVTTGMTLSPAQVTTLKFDPAPGFVGTASFTYTATDNNGTPLTSAPATYHIPVVNNPPVANPTSVSPILNTVTIPTLLPPLTGNDADGTVDSFNIVTVPPVSSGTLQYCINPGVGCALTPIGTSGVSNLTPAQATTIRFTPGSGFTGDYVFTFTTVDNNHQVSQPATFTVPVIPTTPMLVGQPPIAYSYNNAPISSIATAALSTALTGFDPDGTIANYMITSIPVASHGTLTYCTASPAGCGTAVAVGTILTPAQVASVLFTPNPAFMGIATFNYTNKDNDSNISNTATVTIPVVNNPPYASNINNAGINRMSSAVTLDSLSSTDGDGTVVSYTILTIPTPTQGILRLCTAPPAFGCTAVQPGDVLFGTDIKRLSFTPDTLVRSPVVSFLYSTTDNSSNKSNVAVVNIPIINAFELPIELLSFNAFKQGGDAFLSWETAIEKEPIVYQLMNSTDGQNWTIVDRQQAKGKGGITNNYSYLHTHRSGTQYYKLKISSANNFTYSQVRMLTFDNAASYQISLQPNPVTDKLFISTSDGSVMSEVVIYNNEGQKVVELNNLVSGTAIDMNSFHAGLYLIKILDKNGEAQTVKVTKK